MKKELIIILALFTFLSVFAQKNKMQRAYETYNSGEYHEAIDLLTEAYNLTKDRVENALHGPDCDKYLGIWIGNDIIIVLKFMGDCLPKVLKPCRWRITCIAIIQSPLSSISDMLWCIKVGLSNA